jgi:alpha-L-rhamnosidase
MKKSPFLIWLSASPSFWCRFWPAVLSWVWLGAFCLPTRADTEAADWRGSNQRLLRPVKVVSTTGNVQNADALLAGHEGDATLSWSGQGAAPQIILDYGRDVGGLPAFEVTAVSGTPKLQALYSEAQQYLLPGGDAAAPGVPQDPRVAQPEVSFVGDAAGADLARVDTYPLAGPGFFFNRLIQGGERFEAVTLAAPGSVTLRRLGIQPKYFIPQPDLNRGSFHCSDPALNEIWRLGSYAVELCSVPVRSLPPKWTVTSEGVRVPGNEFCDYQAGTTWTDYTASFEVQVLANEVAWLVRATDFNGVRLVLAADDDALGISTPNTLRAYVQFSKAPLGEAKVPDLKPGSWHRVRNEVTDSTLRVFLDDALILTLALPSGGGLFGSIAAGSVAFGNEQGAEALYRNLVVTDPRQALLYQSSLADPAILDQFAAGTNVLASIMDGAKRDRADFTGDIAISGLTLVYSSFEREYFAGSIELFSSFQSPNGVIPISLPPQYHPGVTVTPAPAANASVSLFLPDYPLQHVTSIYSYFRYTGDRAFLQAQWSVVQKVVALSRTTRNTWLFLRPSVRRTR